MSEPCKCCGGKLQEKVCHRCQGTFVEPGIKVEWQDVVKGDPMLEEMAKRFFPDLFKQETVH